MRRLQTRFVGLKLKSPIIVGSSGLTETVERLEKAQRFGAGAAVMKSLFEERVCRRSPTPRFKVIRRSLGDRRSFTFYSYEQASPWGPRRYADEIKKAKRKLYLKIIPSINCVTERGWRDYARMMEGAGADALELNTSCPHGSITFRGQEVEQSIVRTCERVRKAVKVPLIAKISPMLTTPLGLSKKLAEVGVDGLTVFNRMTGLEVDVDKEIPVMHRGYAGHGGPWAIQYSLRWISEISSQIEIDVSGSGGVTSGEDVVKYLLSGARAVQIATLVYLKGFPVIAELNSELARWMEKKHYQEIDDFRGRIVTRLRGTREIDRRFTRIARIDPRPTAPCKSACPVGVPNQAFLYNLREGNLEKAYSLIKSCGPFQEVLGRICPAFCEDECSRALIDKPLSLRQLKRWVLVEGEKKFGYFPRKAKSTGRKVAVVGAGPAGLTCAYDLVRAGHRVVVFEKEKKAGGMLRWGIPRYRLPRKIIDKEIEDIKRLGVKIRLGSKVEDVASLRRQGFSAVFLATGAAEPAKSHLVGEKNILEAVAFLRRINSGVRPRVGKRVAVIGGGNTAVDSARTALRLGARKVYLIYRRTRAEMPAISSEVEAAEKEGVRILYLVIPERISRKDDEIVGLECRNLTLGKSDSSGRRKPERIGSTRFSLAVDAVILALGQRPSAPAGVRIRKDGSTGIKGVFAGGDLLRAATAVEAVAAGRKAAVAMDRYLMGSKAILREPAEMMVVDSRETVARHPEVKVEERIEAPILSLRAGKSNFAEVELTLNGGQARIEAGRCLACGCGEGCGLCQTVCIYSAPRAPADKFEIDPKKCEGCGLCVEVCPHATIEMVKKP